MKHEWLATSEAAAGVSAYPETLKRRAAAGEVPAYRTVGGRLRYTKASRPADPVRC